MKKGLDVVKDFVRKLGDDELKFVGVRLSRKLGGDMGEVVEFLQRHSDLDRWLSTADGAFKFYDMLDQVDGCLQQETKRRAGYEPRAKTQTRW